MEEIPKREIPEYDGSFWGFLTADGAPWPWWLRIYYIGAATLVVVLVPLCLWLQSTGRCGGGDCG